MLQKLIALVLAATAVVEGRKWNLKNKFEDHQVLYERTGPLKDWTQGELSSTDEPIKFIVALKQQNLDKLSEIYDKVTDPAHEEWTNFLEIDEILDIVKPEQADHDSVMSWVERDGSNCKSLGDAIECHTNVKVASEIFQTTFYSFSHKDGRVIHKAMGKYHAPSSVAKHIDLVEGISNFPIPHFNVIHYNDLDGTEMTKRQLKQFGAVSFVPQSTDILYRKGREETNEKGTQGVIEFQGQSFSPSELASYSKQVAIPISADTTVVGPNSPEAPQTEATLDIQWMAGTNNGAQNWFWLEPGSDWVYGFATHFFGTTSVPLINSISYGWAETDQCQIANCAAYGWDSQQYVTRTNTEFQKIGLRGISLMAASGDSGANGRSDAGCSQPTLEPAFPGASPYLTAVGATQLNNAATSLPNPPPACQGQGYTCASGGQEVAVSFDVAQFASGGGFSAYAPTPAYQKDAVAKFLSTSKQLPPSSYFNSAGRGYPDIASIGTGILIYTGGSLQPVGGTSASSPTAAGIMGLLNSHKIKATGKPLGPLNPFLYKMHAEKPGAFNDITIGDNTCTEDGCQPGVCKGFYCEKGWDPVTGLGSCDYKNMNAYLGDLIQKHKDAGRFQNIE